MEKMLASASKSVHGPKDNDIGVQEAMDYLKQVCVCLSLSPLLLRSHFHRSWPSFMAKRSHTILPLATSRWPWKPPSLMLAAAAALRPLTA